jgi:hypothetical protein
MNETSNDIEERIYNLRNRINSRDDFIELLLLLREDFRLNSQEWENASLDQFLDGLMGFARSMDGYYKNKGLSIDLEKPQWRVFADILLAARVYE